MTDTPPAELYLRAYSGPALARDGARYACQGRKLRLVRTGSGQDAWRWVWVYERIDDDEANIQKTTA